MLCCLALQLSRSSLVIVLHELIDVASNCTIRSTRSILGRHCQERKKLTRSSLKGVFNRALQVFVYKNGHFASSFLLSGVGLLKASKKANLLSSEGEKLKHTFFVLEPQRATSRAYILALPLGGKLSQAFPHKKAVQT